MAIEKQYRDMAMHILLDYEKTRTGSTAKFPEYLTIKGLPETVPPMDVVAYLDAKKLITFTPDKGIRLTDSGWTYFEDQLDAESVRREMYRHNWKVAVFSALAGALLARPLWAGLEALFAFVTVLF